MRKASCIHGQKKLINKKKTWLQWSGLSETDSPLPKNESGKDIMKFFSRFGFVFYGFFFSSFYISQHEIKKKSEIGFVKFPLEHNYHFKVLMTSNLVDKLSSILVFTKLYFTSVTFVIWWSRNLLRREVLYVWPTPQQTHTASIISL